MALGNNLKKKKLIPEAEEGQKKKQKATTAKKTNKKVPASKKSDGKKPLAKKAKAAPAKTPVKKKAATVVATKTKPMVSASPVQPQQEPKESPSTSPELPMYIAKELLERKEALKAKYIDEIASLKGKPVQFVILTVGGEKYALDIDDVREIVPLPSISKTPNTPDHIKGIVNVRGNNYVVFDLSSKFRVVGEEFARYLLILDSKELNTSIPLSILPTTFRTNGDQISLSPQLIEDALLDASYIRGIIQNESDLIYYLDIVELLKNDKAIAVPDQLLNKQDD